MELIVYNVLWAATIVLLFREYRRVKKQLAEGELYIAQLMAERNRSFTPQRPIMTPTTRDAAASKIVRNGIVVKDKEGDTPRPATKAELLQAEGFPNGCIP